MFSPRMVRSVPITDAPVAAEAAGANGEFPPRGDAPALPFDWGGVVKGLGSLSGLESNIGVLRRMTLLDKIRIVQTPLREQPTFLRRHFVNDIAGLTGFDGDLFFNYG